MYRKLIIILLFIVVSIFSWMISVDFSVYLRGPAPYPPDWQWEYLFINTFERLWVVVLVLCGLFIFLLLKKSWSDLAFCIWGLVLGILYGMSMLYFGRGGLFVVIHRIINPDLGGYFSQALTINSIYYFFSTYDSQVLSFFQHAQGHPPFSILFYWVINVFSHFLSFIPLDFISIHHKDVLIVWNSLQKNEQIGALISIPIIFILTYGSLIPLYFFTKKLYSKQVAEYATILFLSIPSITLFLPINDVFLPFFVMSSMLLFQKGISNNSHKLMFFSGVVFSCGLLFSISILPTIVVFLSLVVIYFKKKEINLFFKNIVYFSIGILAIPIILFGFGFNCIEVFFTLLKGLPEMRSYHVWLYYNIYDFFIFLGIPNFIITVCIIIKIIQQVIKKEYKEIDIFFVCTIGMLVIVIISGSVRGEVGRIWIPFMPLFVVSVAQFLKKSLHFSRGELFIIVLLQVMQTVFMQEFWVMLW